MLQRAKPTPQLQEWFDKLAPVVEEARTTLRALEPGKLALRSGCERDEDGNFCLDFLWQRHVISADDFGVRAIGTDQQSPSFIQSLILTYLATADGTTPSSRWIGFRELPDGMFYVQAFQGYTGGRLVRELEGGVDTFRRAAETLGGEPLELGDAGYAFQVLPRVHLVVSLLKRWLMGTLHGAVQPEYLGYYLDEFTFRFNRRMSRSRGKLFYRLVQQAVQVGPTTYRDIVSPPNVGPG